MSVRNVNQRFGLASGFPAYVVVYFAIQAVHHLADPLAFCPPQRLTSLGPVKGLG